MRQGPRISTVVTRCKSPTFEWLSLTVGLLPDPPQDCVKLGAEEMVSVAAHITLLKAARRKCLLALNQIHRFGVGGFHEKVSLSLLANDCSVVGASLVVFADTIRLKDGSVIPAKS